MAGQSNCISDSDYVAASNKQKKAIRVQYGIDIAIQTALALYQRNSSKSIARFQNDLADRQMKLSEAIQDHASKYWGQERELLESVFGEGKHSPEYLATSNSWGEFTDTSYDAGKEAWAAYMKNSCMGISPCMEAKWRRNSGLGSIDARNFALRQEEDQAKALNDRRYARQYASLGLGKDILIGVASYQDVAGKTGGNAAAQLTGMLNSLAAAIPAGVQVADNWGASATYAITDARAPFAGGNHKHIPGSDVLPEGTPIYARG